MPNAFFARLDRDRIWRIRELSDLRLLHGNARSNREKEVASRSIVVLSYAHWEGYCSSCAGALVDYLESKKTPYSAIPPAMLLGAMSAAFDRYRDTADNLNSRRKLIVEFQKAIIGDVQKFDRRVILPRSNLNFERLKFIHEVIDVDISPFQKHRIKIDKELVAWRHLVAHGEMFVLDADNAESHTLLCEELMFLTKSTFESAFLSG